MVIIYSSGKMQNGTATVVTVILPLIYGILHNYADNIVDMHIYSGKYAELFVFLCKNLQKGLKSGYIMI